MKLNGHVPAMYSAQTTLRPLNDLLLEDNSVECDRETRAHRDSAAGGSANRIAVFTDNHFDKMNGLTTTLRAVLRHAPPELRPRIYTISDLGSDEPDYLALACTGVPIWWCPEMRMYVPRLRAFRRHLALDDVRLVHITTAGPVGLVARYLAASSRLPSVGSVHTLSPGSATIPSGSPLRGRILERYLRWLYARCEQVLIPSEEMGTRLHHLGWNSDRLSIWARGVDSEAFSPARRSSKLREQWRVCPRRPAVMYAGRLSHDRGLALLQPFTSLLYRHHVPYRLIIGGDGPMLGELRAACPDAVFLGTLPHHEMGTAMASADLFVFPGETDTAGTVVLEAQACGVPALVSQRGAAREQIVHGRTGFACRPGDPVDFAMRATELLRSTECTCASARLAGGTSRRNGQMNQPPIQSFTFDRSVYATADQTTGLPLIALPEGFRYVTFGWTGDPLANGMPTPGVHDGMAAFAAGKGLTRLVRNHERGVGTPFSAPESVYDPVAAGGTVTLLFDTMKGDFVSAEPSLSGTIRNCAGGPTPWGTWLTCEETFDHTGMPHGYIFEVPANGLGDPTPLRQMGRYSHEAVAVDPTTGYVYETEDAGNSSGSTGLCRKLSATCPTVAGCTCWRSQASRRRT